MAQLCLVFRLKSKPDLSAESKLHYSSKITIKAIILYKITRWGDEE